MHQFKSYHVCGLDVEWQHASHEELLLLEEVRVLGYWKEAFNKIKFSCQGSNFVFSSGFKWTIHFQDGARLIITSLKGKCCVIQHISLLHSRCYNYVR